MDGAHESVTITCAEGGSSCFMDTAERCLWKKCNRLLQSNEKLTIPFVLGAMIHITVLILVTISVRNSYTYMELHSYNYMCIVASIVCWGQTVSREETSQKI